MRRHKVTLSIPDDIFKWLKGRSMAPADEIQLMLEYEFAHRFINFSQSKSLMKLAELSQKIKKDPVKMKKVKRQR